MTFSFKKSFNYLFQKKLFGLLIIGVGVIGLLAWVYTSASNRSNIDYRMERELNHIASSVNSNIYNYANTLGYVQAYFRTEGLPDEVTFKRLAQSIEAQQTNHGIQGLGYISIIRENELENFVKTHKKRIQLNIAHLQPGKKIYAPITMVEPMTETRIRRIGWDMLSEKTRRDAIYTAIRSAQLTMSKPLDMSVVFNQDRSQAALLFLLADYKSLEVPQTTEERQAQARGAIYIPMLMDDFFEAALGKPSMDKERVNFSIATIDDSTRAETVIYQRFEAAAENGSLTRSRIIDIYGSPWKITITTFPHFFNFGDRYINNIVAISFLLLIILLYSLFMQTQSLLSHEKKTTELMEVTVAQSRIQAAKLKHLNIINSQTELELDMHQIIKDFFNASLPVSQSTHAFLFFSSKMDHPDMISFYDAYGFASHELHSSSLNLQQLNDLAHNNIIMQEDPESEMLFSHFIKTDDAFKDWIAITLPSREFRRCGILFLAREKGESYSDVDIEMIDSLVSQFGVRIDNLRLFKKVEDSNKMKTAFLSNMSHEIRTPLNAIIGFSEILEQTRSPEEKHNLIESIKKNTSHLTSIIDNILDISKIEFGRILINSKASPIPALIKNLETEMKVRALAKGLSFKIETVGKIPAYIETDESRVKQILINLVGNAIKFTDYGSVTLQIRSDLTNESHPYLIFNVIDTGIGISTSSQSHLFQSFTQVEISNTRRFGGIGLGLALSKRLAQQFGGDVVLMQSELHQGSTFQLRIPCGDSVKIKWLSHLSEEAEIPQATESPRAQLQNKKILIVEDSLDNQEIFNYFLTSAGALTEMVDNGEDAVKKAENFEYDLILMDIQLPKIDGLEATRRIRARGYLGPIVALTAHASTEEKISCLDAGCIDLITKPVTQMSLIKKVQAILEEETHVQY